MSDVQDVSEPGATCPDCRERGERVAVTEAWDHRGSESYLKASCPACGWASNYGPI